MSNKLYLGFLVFLTFSVSEGIAQNSVPEVTDLIAFIDTVSKKVEITYNLSDAETDSMEVFLKISSDSGKTYLFPIPSDLSGDIGYPILPGGNKKIIGTYPPEITSVNNFVFKIVADDRYSLNVKDLVDLVDTNRIKENLMFIQGVRHRTAGAAHLKEVKDTIEARFIRHNLETRRQKFTSFGMSGENIIGMHRGLLDEKSTFLIDSHFDSVEGTPGADDNGSGVAVMLEVMRILSAYNFNMSIKFAGFDLEEEGLVGSKRYVASGISDSVNIMGVFNYEMIGYYSEAQNSQQLPFGFNQLFPKQYDSVAAHNFKGDFLLNISNTNSKMLGDAFAKYSKEYVSDLRIISLSVPGTGTNTPDFRRSDHAAFWDKGFKALMFTDGAEFRNKYYHTRHDILDSLNFGFMGKIARATIAAVATLSGPIHAGIGLCTKFCIKPTSVEPYNIEYNFRLEQNYPNPFNPETTIEYQIVSLSKVNLKLYDLLGREVRILRDEIQNAGKYSIKFRQSDLSSGIYIYKLQAVSLIDGSSYMSSARMVLLK